MKRTFNDFETNRLLQAVHYYVMHLREMNATGSEDYSTLSAFEKFLLDADYIEVTSNLPF